MRRAPFLLGLLLGTAVPMGLMAQGVPIIDSSRLSNFISRIAEQAEDAVKQGEKLTTRSELSEIEDEQLAAPSEVDAGCRRGLEPLFERLLEGQRRGVLASGHRAATVRPRTPSSERSRASSFAETIPRRRAWRIPCCTRSAATLASMQSRRVRSGAVTGTAE